MKIAASGAYIGLQAQKVPAEQCEQAICAARQMGCSVAALQRGFAANANLWQQA